ncbi:MAG: CPBP family intramembrane glutamic endopeptidase [Pseudomonadota bacterium]
MAAFFGQYSLFSVVWLLAGVAALLLIFTPGFQWSMLWRGPVLGEWRLILVFVLATAATCAAFVFALVPERFLEIPRNRPELWIMIITAYPLLSAWPQELIYRSLFFERYGVLFSSPMVLILANGVVFGLGHLFYMNAVTILMTAAGGAIMGWAYLRGRSMLLAWVLHALAGNLVFTMGLGTFFYSGAVGG